VIPVKRAPEPEDFDERVRKPGQEWLASGSVGEMPSHWTHCKPALSEAFSHRCGYLAMFDSIGGTVDHYLPKSTHPQLAYEWTNYRLCSTLMNQNELPPLLDADESEQGHLSGP
jgi:hypothetical protein